jgi:hypothetical protein
MKMADQDPADVPPKVQADACRASLPRRPSIGVVETGIQERPSIRAIDQVHGHEPERNRHGQLQLVDGIGHGGNLTYGLRP